jgi:hypothetical protein
VHIQRPARLTIGSISASPPTTTRQSLAEPRNRRVRWTCSTATVRLTRETPAPR